jgi:hypothetical protein
MAASRFTIQVAAVIQANSRMGTTKDMEHMSGLVETDTSGNGLRMSNTGMEYSDELKDMYTMDNGNKIRKMAMDILDGKMVTNTMGSTKMI